MTTLNRIDALSYYDFLPTAAHQCGDIWGGLTSFGMLGPAGVTGIVITPACDLSWSKSETVTYLPIVPVRSYFSLDAAMPLVMPRLLNLLTSVRRDLTPKWEKDGFFPPTPTEVTACITAFEGLLSRKPLALKTTTALEGALAGLEILNAICQPGLSSVSPATLQNFFGRDWPGLKERIIANNFSPATHFLPADAQDSAFSAVREHSLALFRYPITLPVRTLFLAQETAPANWAALIDNSTLSAPLRDSIRGEHPMKLLSLRGPFLSDLLTRYSALYNRIGSPDFSKDTIARYATEVDQ